MPHIIILKYDLRDIPITNEKDMYGDLSVKPYLDAANAIAEKYGLKTGGLSARPKGFFRKGWLLDNFQYNADTLDSAFEFAEAAMTAKIGLQDLVDNVEIRRGWEVVGD